MSEYKNSNFKRYYHVQVEKDDHGTTTLCGEYIPVINSRGQKARVEGDEAEAGRTRCPECDSLYKLDREMRRFGKPVHEFHTLVVPPLLDEVDDILRQLNA